MIVSITGATGFIGAKLVKNHLIKGNEIRYLTRTNSTPIKSAVAFMGDLNSNTDNLKLFLTETNVLINCAGEISNEKLMHSTHVDGTANLLKLIEQTKLPDGNDFHWIQLSSCGAYGIESPKSNEMKITEHTPTSPQNTYEITKTMADDLIVEFAKKNDWFKYTIIRPTIVFGVGMRSSAIQRLIKLVKLRLFFYIEDKQAIANYVDVDDVVNAIDLCVANEKAFNQIFIVSNDCQFKEFINAIAKSVNVRNPLLTLKKNVAFKLVSIINFFGLKSIKKEQLNVLSRKVHFSSLKIQSAIGWKPKANVPEQIENMISKIK